MSWIGPFILRAAALPAPRVIPFTSRREAPVGHAHSGTIFQGDRS